MSKIHKMLAALPYAHLLSASAARADDSDDGDDEMKQGADESDEDYAERMEEKEKEDAKKAKKAAKADGDKQGDDESDEDYAKRMEGADDDEKDGKDGKAKRARKAEDADDDKEQATRASERARCAAIFKCKAAAGRPDVAAYLAFETDMSVTAAVGMLSTVSAGSVRPAGLASRMASTAIPNVGAGGPPATSQSTGSKAMAEQIVAADKRRRGEA